MSTTVISSVELPFAEDDAMSMNMLFDNDRYAVVSIEYTKALPDMLLSLFLGFNGHVPVPCTGYEIADKTNLTEVFLTDHMAAAFTEQIARWRENVPSESEVCEVLESLMQVGTMPLSAH